MATYTTSQHMGQEACDGLTKAIIYLEGSRPLRGDEIHNNFIKVLKITLDYLKTNIRDGSFVSAAPGDNCTILTQEEPLDSENYDLFDMKCEQDEESLEALLIGKEYTESEDHVKVENPGSPVKTVTGMIQNILDSWPATQASNINSVPGNYWECEGPKDLIQTVQSTVTREYMQRTKDNTHTACTGLVLHDDDSHDMHEAKSSSQSIDTMPDVEFRKGKVNCRQFVEPIRVRMSPASGYRICSSPIVNGSTSSSIDATNHSPIGIEDLQQASEASLSGAIQSRASQKPKIKGQQSNKSKEAVDISLTYNSVKQKEHSKSGDCLENRASQQSRESKRTGVYNSATEVQSNAESQEVVQSPVSKSNRKNNTGKGTRPRIICHICGLSLKNRHSLPNHLKLHRGEKRHVCGLCGKAFMCTTDLTRHMDYHTGERSYICDICGKMFVTQSHLRRHNFLHSGEMPHSCTLCDRQFIQKGNLKIHMKVHRNGK